MQPVTGQCTRLALRIAKIFLTCCLCIWIAFSFPDSEKLTLGNELSAYTDNLSVHGRPVLIACTPLLHVCVIISGKKDGVWSMRIPKIRHRQSYLKESFSMK